MRPANCESAFTHVAITLAECERQVAMALDVELYRRTVYMPSQHAGRMPRRVSVIDIQPEGATHTLVLVHGYGGNALQWLYQLRFFGSRFRVIAPELRGHGLSTDTHDQAYTLDGLVSDLAYVLDAMQVAHPFVLIAHSFGGAVAIEYALRYAETLAGLVLIGVPSRFILRPSIRSLMNIPDPLFSSLARIVKVALFAPQRTLKALEPVMTSWDGRARMSDLRVPTLVVLGQRDTVFLREHYDDVPRSIVNAQRVVISVSAHLVQLERPDAVNRVLRRFLGALGFAQRVSGRNLPSQAATQSNSSHTINRFIDMPWLQHYDDNVPEQLPLPQQPLHDMLSNNALAYPHQTALIFFGQKMSYRELDRLTNRFAHALQTLGVKEGDRVAIVLPNIPQCIIGFYGALKAGAVVVLGSPLSSEDEIHYQLRDSGAKVLFTLASYCAKAPALCADTSVQHVIYTDVREYLPLQQRLRLTRLVKDIASPSTDDKREQETSASSPSWHEYTLQHLLRSQPATLLTGNPGSEHLALIQYTSGTTDVPKGVMLTHCNLMVNVAQIRYWMPDARRGHEVFLGVLPLSHAYGITSAMNCAMSLASVLVLLPTNRIEQIMHAIKTYRPSIFPGIPPQYLAIANYPRVRSYGVSAIRICVSGSEALPVEVQEAFEKLTRGHLVEGYGLTEASPVTHANPLKGERRVGSIGLPLPGTNARIVDVRTGEAVPPGVVGELLVQGPQVMQGYWKRSEETAQVYIDGWLHTGDLARMDEDGFFSIVDRKKDAILTGTFNVYPRDVEEVLYEHPKVLEAAVVNTGSGTIPSMKAFVVLKRGEQTTAEELLALCRERLDAYKVPRQIEFRSELPKNIVGKVLRRLLVV
jgi:long-chain acyl-CoA synthetase